ncbi:hypothetical protein AB8613_23905 [Vibrio sp. BS-M-Sm-2]|uniref:HTH-like domain-containing protein n=1 Tax=Vibrio sp. BS-M-Sm-2 TaxID=3241167 RepID=UPI003555E684
MNDGKVFSDMKDKISSAEEGLAVATVHAQMLKNMESILSLGIGSLELCRMLDVSPMYASEFLKMKKLYKFLIDAGLDPKKL